MKIEKVYPAGWKVTNNDGEITYFGQYGRFGCYCNDWVVYKDDSAFESGEGVCYVNEYGFENSEQNGNELFDFEAKEYVASVIGSDPYWALSGYTRKDLEAICEGHTFDARELFDHLDWQSAETLVNEWSEYEEEND